MYDMGNIKFDNIKACYTIVIRCETKVLKDPETEEITPYRDLSVVPLN